MRHNEGYHRKRGPWRPSERQRQVLDLLVEDKSNAEIAVHLGITPDGVKWHISELLGETGRDDRQALVQWWVEERDRPRQPAFLPLLSRVPRVAIAGSAAALVLTVVAMSLLWGGDGGGEEPTIPEALVADVAPSPTLVPEPAIDPGPPPPCDTPLPDGFRIVTAEELRDEGLVELGRVIQPQTCPLRVDNRADLAFFWLADGGEIDPSVAGLHFVSRFGRPGSGTYYGGSNYPPADLGFYYEGEEFMASMFFVSTSTDAVEMAIEERDQIRFNRVGSEGAFASVSLQGEESGRHRVAFASDGTLFFDPGPFPGGLATNSSTGETIDVSGLIRLGQIEFTSVGIPEGAWTSCRLTTSVCSVGLPAVQQPMKLPVGGVLTCVPVMSAGIEREGYEIDTGDFVLRFSPIGGYGVPWNGACATVSQWRDSLSHTITPGDEVYTWTYTSIEAFAADGSPISLVITRDGRLYVGDVALDIGCPCRSGS